MDDNKHKVLNEFDYDQIKQIAFFITVAIGAIHFVWKLLTIRYWIKHRDQLHAEQYPLEEETTLEMRKITDNSQLMVRLNDSKDTNGFPDAYTCGGQTIMYNSLMKRLLNKNELLAICLHEYGHIAKGHNNMLLVVDASHTIMMYTFASTLAFFGLPFALLVIWLVEYVFGLRELSFTLYDLVTSKRQEYAADSVAAKYGYGKYFINAQTKLDSIMRSNICYGLPKKQCDKMMKSIFKWADHPSNEKRIKKISKLILKKYFKTTKDLNPSDLKISKRKLAKLMKQKELESSISEE